MSNYGFDKVLVANRGEIALRIMRTLKAMGIKTVAIYSEADTDSLHVKYADEAYYVGNSPAISSYLNIQNITNVIRASGVSAVHPGYGFLSENAKFALALEKEGVHLIGPSSYAIKVMGDKIEAKKIAIESGVNTVPGYVGVINSEKEALEIARSIGFPVIVKAAAGGGGRGMRTVYEDEQMKDAFFSAKLEATNSFSDGRVFIEKLIENPRHIEVQVLADKYGNVVCLGERECSLQRYHQKVIEEAPSVIIDEDLRQKMYEQVRALVKKVGYYSAGTVEFIFDQNKNFYFLEMNTRLQVEHTVTEYITGIDIVKEMVKIAAGGKLEFKQEDIKLNGWSIECRVYSEDPSRGFLPSSGRIREYIEPTTSENVRIDSGVSGGSEISMFYDSMISKIITWGPTRLDAITTMQNALSRYIISGVAHNISFLEALMHHSKFVEGNISTNFIQEEYSKGFVGTDLRSDTTLVFLAAAVYIFLKEHIREATIDDGSVKGQNTMKIGTRWVVNIEDKFFPVIIRPIENGYKIRQGINRILVNSSWNVGDKIFTAVVNGKIVNIKLEYVTSGYKLTYSGVSVKTFVRSPRMSELEAIVAKKPLSINNTDELLAPISGQVKSVKVKEGDSVSKGSELVTLLAMKMENIILAEFDAVVARVNVKESDCVDSGQILLEFE